MLMLRTCSMFAVHLRPGERPARPRRKMSPGKSSAGANCSPKGRARPPDTPTTFAADTAASTAFAAEDSGRYTLPREAKQNGAGQRRLANNLERAPFYQRPSGGRDRSGANADSGQAAFVDDRASQ